MTYTVKVTIAFDDEVVELGSNDIIEVSYSSNLMDSDLQMVPGICEQNATVKFFDYSKRIENRFASNDTTNATVTIIVRDSNGNVVESRFYYSSTYDIDNDNDIVTINCIDSTKILKDITVPQALIATRTADDLLTIFFNYLPQDNQWEYYDEETKTRCQGITVPNSWYREDTLENFLNKICVLGLLRVFCVSNKFYVARCI